VAQRDEAIQALESRAAEERQLNRNAMTALQNKVRTARSVVAALLPCSRAFFTLLPLLLNSSYCSRALVPPPYRTHILSIKTFRRNAQPLSPHRLTRARGLLLPR
jgi:hypothetical protein